MKKKIILAIVASMTMAMVGCGTSDTSNDTTQAKDTLIIGCSNFSNSFDPSADANSAWGTARMGIGETLFMFDENMNAVPHLAEGYTVNDAKTSWDIKIRDDVYFSNGTKLTASMVKDSIEYLYTQEESGQGMNAISQFMLYDDMSADDEAGILTINTARAYVDLSKILSHVNFVIMDVNGSENMDESPIGTGPYAVETNNIGVSTKFVANEYYWASEVGFDYLEAIYMTDSTTKALALQAGDVDLVDSITTSNDLDTLRDSEEFNVHETLSARTAFSYVNHQGVLANDILREAVFLGVDEETICTYTTGGVYSAAFSVLPSTLDYGFENLTDKTPYNLETAKSMLDDAGIVDTDGNGIRELDGEDIVLSYIGSVSKSLDKVSEAVGVNLKELGIGVDLQILDADTLWSMTMNQEFDLSICSWMTVPSGDPVAFLESWYSKSVGIMNHGSFYSEAYDVLYDELIAELDSEEQKEIIEKLQQILIDECAVLVHGSYTSNLSSNNKIQGVVMPMSEAYWVSANIKPAQ